MNRTRVKICGQTREADLTASVSAGADAVGVIVDVPVDTPREISADQARDLVATVPPFVTAVLVTMAESPDRVATLVETVDPDAVQLHGGYDPAVVVDLADRLPVDVVATTHVGDPQAAAYADAADAVLVDSTDEAGGGGTGRTHDWERSRTLVAETDVPVLLAGGLTPTNVTEAVRTVGPYAVDVASGVEASGGLKDHDAVEQFVRRATGAGTAEVEP
ncbi:MAG: phosphoribosylanthranilate isomerase [Halobacteriaceae archaeon]